MQRLIGIDEVGRGPVAGPVCVAAFSSTKKDLSHILRRSKLPLRDSKKLSRKQREEWFDHLCLLQEAGRCTFSVSLVHARIIDRDGISKAVRHALNRSLRKVSALSSHTILLDGLLYAPKHYKKQTTIIKGDEKEPLIALASIIAKVHRDRYMHRLHERHPHYGFINHVGYGTKEHYDAILAHGMVMAHRTTYLLKLFVR